MIKAILRNGIIHPLEPIPSYWPDGQELLIEEPEVIPSAAQLQEWARDLETGVAELPEEENDRFRKALIEIEQESKDAAIAVDD